jgi:hypothetical protein
MRTLIFALALLLTGVFASGCLLTRRLLDPNQLSPESYGELQGVERRGPGEDLFIYYIHGHTGAAEGYYGIQPAAEPGSPPKVMWLEHGDTISPEVLERVPVLQTRDRRSALAGESSDPENPSYRIVRAPDRLGRETHAYERWSPARSEWIRVGACAMGTRRYLVKEHPATVLLLLPWTLAIDAVSAPIQFFILLIRRGGRQILRDIGYAIADEATTAVLGAASRRVRRRLR